MTVQKYGQQNRLFHNQRYRITLKLPQQNSFEFQFTSRYDPWYCSTRLVMGDIRHVLENVSQEDVAQKIWLVSMELKEIMEEEGIQIPDKPSNIMQRYVRYQSNYKLMLGVLSGKSAHSGKVDRKLRDLSIGKTIASPESDILDRWKLLAEEALSLLIEDNFTAKPFLKAGDTSTFGLGRGF